jgi:uncharacterized protein YkwD
MLNRVNVYIFLGLIVAVSMWLAGGSNVLAQEGADETPVTAEGRAFELEVVSLANQERTAHGLPPLRYNSSLTEAARAHNQDMITHNFFGHTGSDGSDAWDRACAHGYAAYGWGECFVGENISVGYKTPAETVAGWMQSQGHRDIILNPNFREIGVGHSTGGSWGNYWTMDLGAQPMVLPIFINDNAEQTVSNEVMLTLTREDVSNWGSLGPITGVQISENASLTGAAWRKWSQTIPFTLSPGGGVKTVYVRFTDGTHQVISSDSISIVKANSSSYLPALQRYKKFQ